jgi:hypothetical protein
MFVVALDKSLRELDRQPDPISQYQRIHNSFLSIDPEEMEMAIAIDGAIGGGGAADARGGGGAAGVPAGARAAGGSPVHRPRQPPPRREGDYRRALLRLLHTH